MSETACYASINNPTLSSCELCMVTSNALNKCKERGTTNKTQLSRRVLLRHLL